MAARLIDLPRGRPLAAAGHRRQALIDASLPVRARLAHWYRPLIFGLGVGGAFFGIVSVLQGYAIGMWPPHDSSAYWLAGRHILENKEVYGGGISWFLAFLYPPPLAIVVAPLSLLPYHVFSMTLIGLQVAALRYVTGSWLAVGMLGWIPGVHYEFVAGNIDCLIAAAMYASVTGRQFAGIAVATVGLAKFAPALVMLKATRRQWLEFLVTTAILFAITLPWLGLWGDWIGKLAIREPYTGPFPFMIRLPVAILLLAHRRPWSVAAGAALAMPIFYEAQSVVLLLPAIRLWWDARARSPVDAAAVDATQIAAAEGRPAAGVTSLGLTAEAPTS